MLEFNAEDIVSTSFVMRLRTSPTVVLSKNLSGSLFIFLLMLLVEFPFIRLIRYIINPYIQ